MKRNRYALNKIEMVLNWFLFWRSRYEPFYWYTKHYREHDLYAGVTKLKGSDSKVYIFKKRKLLKIVCTN